MKQRGGVGAFRREQYALSAGMKSSKTRDVVTEGG
jgi:hypothetical protein